MWALLAASSQAGEPAAGPRVGGDGGGTPASPGLCFSPLRHGGQMRVCPPAHGLGPRAEGHQCRAAKGGCSAHKWQSCCGMGGGLLPRLPPPRTATMTTASLASGSADRVPGLFCAVHAPSSQQPLAAGAFVIHTLQIRKSRHRGAREPRPPNSRGVEGAVHSETLTAGSAIFNPVKRPQPGFSQRLSGARPWGARDVGPGGGERP